MKPTLERSLDEGTQKLYRFDNGYGASVLDNRFSKGLELAVLRFDGEKITDFHLTYDTPITDDVIGYNSPDEIETLLTKINALPSITQGAT